MGCLEKLRYPYCLCDLRPSISERMELAVLWWFDLARLEFVIVHLFRCRGAVFELLA